MLEELVSLRAKYEDAVMHSISQGARLRDLQTQAAARRRATITKENGRPIDDGLGAVNGESDFQKQGVSLLAGNPRRRRVESPPRFTIGLVHLIIISVASFLLAKLVFSPASNGQ